NQAARVFQALRADDLVRAKNLGRNGSLLRFRSDAPKVAAAGRSRAKKQTKRPKAKLVELSEKEVIKLIAELNAALDDRDAEIEELSAYADQLEAELEQLSQSPPVVRVPAELLG